jgi:hypothetical protein
MTSTARRTAALIAAVATCLVLAPTAQAGPLVASDPDCAAESLSQPFLPWADVANYQLAPGGTFERGAAGWNLDGASVRGGNESFYVHGDGERSSLGLPAGSVATTPTICVGLEHPTIRFFARADGAGLTSSLKVEVLFETASGDVASAPIGAVSGSGDWRPSAPLPIVANLLPLLPGDHTPVQFRLTPQGSGDWQVDDFYVDPYRRS